MNIIDLTKKKAIFIPDEQLKSSVNIDGNEYFLVKAGETKLEKLAGSKDGYLFEWNDSSGMTLYVILNNVSANELSCIIDTGREFEIAFTEMNDCGFLSVKFGNLPWGEGSFEPCLYEILDMPAYDDYNTQGMALTICVVDPVKGGLVMGNRIIGLGHDFSVGFAKWVHKVYFDKARRSVFNVSRHYEKVADVYNKYTSNELQTKASYRWRLSGMGEDKKRNAINIAENREK